MTKKEIRNDMIRRRIETNSDLLKLQSQSIINQVKSDKDYKHSKIVAIFYPMSTEVDLLPLLNDKHKLFCFPRVEGEHIHFYLYDQTQPFKKSTFGVLEPDGGICVDSNIDYMLAPALAISKEKYRVGYGKGFYDRFLKMSRPKKVMGVIYDFQELDFIPHDAYDEVLDGYYKGNL